MTGSHVIVGHARSDEQKKVLEDIVESGECPFCIGNLTKHHKLPITLATDHWFVTENQWPYKNAGIQVLIIPVRHVETILELTTQEWADWATVVVQASYLYNIDAGAICMRFGDPEVSGASVRHLHSQLIVPNPEAKAPVRYKIGK